MIAGETTCEICGTRFKKRLRHDAKNRFCSRTCGGKAALVIANKRDRYGRLNPAWKGGRRINHNGYVLIYHPGHPYPNTSHGRHVFEHRLVMEQHLGRYLNPGEIVHHKNGNKQDNRIENLELMTQSEHAREHYSLYQYQYGR